MSEKELVGKFTKYVMILAVVVGLFGGTIVVFGGLEILSRTVFVVAVLIWVILSAISMFVLVRWMRRQQAALALRGEQTQGEQGQGQSTQGAQAQTERATQGASEQASESPLPIMPPPGDFAPPVATDSTDGYHSIIDEGR